MKRGGLTATACQHLAQPCLGPPHSPPPPSPAFFPGLGPEVRAPPSFLLSALLGSHRPIGTFSPPSTSLPPFSLLPPFVRLILVCSCFSLCFRQPFPLPGPAPLGVVPTSLSTWPPGLFFRLGEAARRGPGPESCVRRIIWSLRRPLAGGPGAGGWRGGLSCSGLGLTGPCPHHFLVRKEAAEAGDTEMNHPQPGGRCPWGDEITTCQFQGSPPCRAPHL